MLGPFGGYWLAWVQLMLHADATDDWGSWSLWVATPIWLAYTIFSMLMQVAIVPKVLNWIQTAPIGSGHAQPGDEGDAENTLAADLLGF